MSQRNRSDRYKDHHKRDKRDKRDDRDQQPSVLRFLVNNEEAGIIIGKKGANIRLFRKETETFISLSPPGSGVRTLTITGSPEGIHKVIPLVCDKVVVEKGKDQKDSLSFSLLIQTNEIGRLIGKGGQTVRDIQNSSESRIDISKEILGQSTEQIVKITANVKQCASAIKSIFDLMDTSKTKPQIQTSFFESSIHERGPPTHDRLSGHDRTHDRLSDRDRVNNHNRDGFYDDSHYRDVHDVRDYHYERTDRPTREYVMYPSSGRSSQMIGRQSIRENIRPTVYRDEYEIIESSQPGQPAQSSYSGQGYRLIRSNKPPPNVEYIEARPGVYQAIQGEPDYEIAPGQAIERRQVELVPVEIRSGEDYYEPENVPGRYIEEVYDPQHPQSSQGYQQYSTPVHGQRQYQSVSQQYGTSSISGRKRTITQSQDTHHESHTSQQSHSNISYNNVNAHTSQLHDMRDIRSKSRYEGSRDQGGLPPHDSGQIHDPIQQQIPQDGRNSSCKFYGILGCRSGSQCKFTHEPPLQQAEDSLLIKKHSCKCPVGHPFKNRTSLKPGIGYVCENCNFVFAQNTGAGQSQ